ncbi:MAG TPA: 4Fe-4S dicluster domain-containing protein [Labilithrix sp.]|nr:4Fe-4S dicluster domain-containing protein [Labilithrix sp.]
MTIPRAPYESLRRARAASLSAELEGVGADPIARRDFLNRMGAALALAGLGACTRAPREEIVPYVIQPPEVRPGFPAFYATASVLDGYATGLVVESHTGRPTKIEGNPEHPASLGAAGAFEQAAVLSLYDPTRARGVMARGAIATWDEMARTLSQGPWVNDAGRGLHLCLEPTSSMTVIGLVERIRRRLPRAVVSFLPTGNAHAWSGSRIAFGRVLEPRFAINRADVIVALDSDFLATGPAYLRYAREFARRRALGAQGMNRLYVAEPLRTVTGNMADHRLRVRASSVRGVATLLASTLAIRELEGKLPPALVAPIESERRWVEAAARDLLAHRGRSLVIVGADQPPEIHALAHAMNASLGNLGATVTLGPSPLADAGAPSSRALSDALGAGEVDTLVVCGQNPVYASPTKDLGSLFARARQSAYLGLYDDETAAACTFTIARAHPLEAWGDARAYDGTASIIQPLIEPLFGGRTEIELLSLFAGQLGVNAHTLVKSGFREWAVGNTADGGTLERAWRTALKRGIVEGSALATIEPKVDWAGIGDALMKLTSPAPLARGELELVSRLDPHVHDGRFANNAWLLEFPSPIEKLTWTNAATLSAPTAANLGISNGDEIELRTNDGAEVRAPACIVPGQVDHSVGLTLGWGRTRGAPLAEGKGANAFILAGRSTVTLAKTGRTRELPITQTQRELVGRDHEILRHGRIGEHPLGAPAEPPPPPRRRLTLYDREPGPSNWQWAMAIDLSRCTGCGACVVACQAENNVPTVGPDNVVLNREMHWLRIDSYYLGDPTDPKIAPQPMLCQHCESAPCEYVCPVNATVHSPDGLNEMVYNRCVGTRFCSNNCPYKIRRFNWFDFHRAETATEQLVHNPDVTVRQRGVMEKCTFCVQRLRQWEIKEQQGRPAPTPVTACQQTCPTEAIVFGDLHAPNSEVARLHHDERAYRALEELGTEPRVRYLARLANPNPELA